MKVLSRINPLETYHRVSCRRKACEDVVISGLSITPSDIERLARQGVPVSVPNASSFFLLILGWKFLLNCALMLIGIPFGSFRKLPSVVLCRLVVVKKIY
jgi:hypothetical protein